MDLLAAWVAFPALLFVLCGGAGLVVDRLTGRRLPAPLVVVCGYAAIVVAGQFTTLADATAEWTAPMVVALAVAGWAVGLRGRERPAGAWAFAAAGAFAIYAAPIVLSGEPTTAGFIRLDDTATWLSLTDRIVDHGRDLSGLAPSSYEATLSFNLGDGYPIGVFVPLAVGGRLTGIDIAWLMQPYIAFGAALLALSLWPLARSLERLPLVRAGAAGLAAVSALLFGYALWGGVKEVYAAALIAAAAALALAVLERPERGPIAVLALGCAALLGVTSAGGLVWVAAPLVAVAVLLADRIGPRPAAIRAAAFAAALVVLCLPLIVSGALLPPTSSPLTDGAARGNLIAPLEPLQAAGIWPAGDFRVVPDAEVATYVLIAVACAAAAGALWWALRRGEAGPPLYVLGTLLGCAVLVLVGSPWVGGKALATASPAIPFAAMLGAGALVLARRRLAAGALAIVVAGGVIWSDALGYGDVSLAPHDQLAELERIGERIAGEGPALMTEYEPYGVRHFLRDADPEGISELRRRRVPLRGGDLVEKGGSADTDRIDPTALAVYRTLVLRRSPAQSRPPAAYRPIWRGADYEVWQRSADRLALPERLPLGGADDPYAVPSCADVLALARSGDLIAAAGEPPIVVPLSQATYPAGWALGDRDQPVPTGPGSIRARVDVERPGRYEIWLGGSLSPSATLLVDGSEAGEVRGVLNNRGQYVRLGEADLNRGEHEVEVRIGGADLHPGSAGGSGPFGPLSLSATGPADERLVRVTAARARSLCGHEWDWIEVDG